MLYMPKTYRKKAPRRRLQKAQLANAIADYAVNTAIKHGPRLAGKGFAYIKAKADAKFKASRNKRPARPTKFSKNYSNNLMASDNIAKLSPTIIGKKAPLTFEERVARVSHPPISFKRNYQFNVESNIMSGKKAWFSFEFNILNNNDLLNDVTAWKSQMYTDTAAPDPTVSGNSYFDGAKWYVDYLSEKLQICNSSAIPATGKIHLFRHKINNDNTYQGVPITPINLMMLYSTNRLPAQFSGNEATVGNGWKFDAATNGSNYNSVYNMPGSSINSSGVPAITDHTLSPNSVHIKDSISYWFDHVESTPFSLKPGQQFDKSYIFNDLRNICREETEYIHLRSVSYSCVVEFQGGIVGSSVVTSGDGVVSTGNPQLSCIRSSVRQIGAKQKLRPKTVLITAAPAIIDGGNQRIINPDTGIELVGSTQDI